jgi:hypothetical protein
MAPVLSIKRIGFAGALLAALSHGLNFHHEALEGDEGFG